MSGRRDSLRRNDPEQVQTVGGAAAALSASWAPVPPCDASRHERPLRASRAPRASTSSATAPPAAGRSPTCSRPRCAAASTSSSCATSSADDDELLRSRRARARPLRRGRRAVHRSTTALTWRVRAGADGVHVGQDDGSRRRRPRSRRDRAARRPLDARARASSPRPPDADYVAVGPVHETPTKPGRPAVGLELRPPCRRARASLPVVRDRRHRRRQRRPRSSRPARRGSSSSARSPRPATPSVRHASCGRRSRRRERSWRRLATLRPTAASPSRIGAAPRLCARARARRADPRAASSRWRRASGRGRCSSPPRSRRCSASANVVLYAAGAEIDGTSPSAAGVGVFALVVIALAVGMLRGSLLGGARLPSAARGDRDRRRAVADGRVQRARAGCSAWASPASAAGCSGSSCG